MLAGDVAPMIRRASQGYQWVRKGLGSTTPMTLQVNSGEKLIVSCHWILPGIHIMLIGSSPVHGGIDFSILSLLRAN